MIGTLSDEFEVNVPAREAWALYGTLQFTYICVPDLFDKVDVLKGDGGPGTILQPFTKPGTGALFYTYEDEISKVDDKHMVKEVRAHKGGYLSLGFNSYGVRFEVIKKSENSCITKVTVHYDVKEGFISNTSQVSIEPFTALVKYSNNHLIKNHKK
ncbi:hypothetical protein RJ640_000962 [Escallonia rubra]|uniref:Bet v I/Major latex protein domain-containing protein n=1 Tax=Escallonia rubra TaxID=112253 RepID=A0AA88QDD6_9ASTE|nr:hypothetical protein RJ640_000961 [Escallonia rubra]KAK2965998.1 hypothetical protein RJ640_000962 [Escallonia rubra]